MQKLEGFGTCLGGRLLVGLIVHVQNEQLGTELLCQ